MIDIRDGLCYVIKCRHYLIELYIYFAYRRDLCVPIYNPYIPAHEEEDEGDDAEDADDDGDTHEDRGSSEGRGENRSEVVQSSSADISPILAEMYRTGQTLLKCFQTKKDRQGESQQNVMICSFEELRDKTYCTQALNLRIIEGSLVEFH